MLVSINAADAVTNRSNRLTSEPVMADREVCIVPATSAARRSIRRHFREWKADSASLIQPCAAKYVKGRRQLRLRQEGSLLHLLIAMARVLWELLQQKVAGGKMAHPARAFDFRDVPSLTVAVASAIAFACFWQYRDAYATLSYALFCCLVRPAATSPSHSSSQAISASSIFQQQPSLS